jgi:exopolyphosphatase/guanosine-5'-triphosphate,3'-diphosphate pyrophosphatase
VVRDDVGMPLVIRNAPLLEDGTPMPTRYWLVGRQARLDVDRLEAAGGVRQAEADVDPGELDAAHASYAAERDRDIPEGWRGPRPSGGVGGTRRGVKCLHAHYAWHLAGGADPVGRWVAERMTLPDRRTSPPAAIDCGTNSTRMLIGYPPRGIVESRNRITRLGQGVDKSRRLDPEAIDRTLATLREYRQLLDHHGVTKIRMSATSAARDATNSEDFFAPAEAIIGVRPVLLGGAEEGTLSFLGATSDLDPHAGPWLIVDIGGGSTEMVAGPAGDGGPTAVHSLDIGCVRVTERFLHSDPPRPDELAAAREFTGELIREVIETEPQYTKAATLVGLAGTVSCLSAVDQGIDGYDRGKLHHHLLTAQSVTRMLESLSSVTTAARRLIPGVEPGRADVIVAGTLILHEVMKAFGFDSCLTSEADILDGLVISAAASP